MLNGGKMWISLGNHAKVAMIFAQTDPEKKHRGLACFLVPTDSPGFSTQEIHGKMGLHGSDTASIALDDVEVADDALMGEVGDGFKIAMSALDSGRYSVAAGCVGVCQGSLDHSVAYAKEREQFGRPIASFQLVQAMIADMRVQTDAARLLVYRAGHLKDTGKPSTTETSIAKLYATEAAQNCAHLAIQVHGGSGYVDDHPVERYFRDVRVTTLYEGTSQIQKLIIGRAETGINALAYGMETMSKIVLITGGARGIGAATAGELARRGWVPVLADVDEEALAASAFETVVLDVRDAAACERAVAEVVERHGRLDAVWANAGIGTFGPLAAAEPEAGSGRSRSTCWARSAPSARRCRRSRRAAATSP